MLIIRHEQMIAFERSAVSAFSTQIMKDLRRVIPDKVDSFNDNALHASVTARIDHAMSFGITSKSDVRRYVECSYVLEWPEGKSAGSACDTLLRGFGVRLVY